MNDAETSRQSNDSAAWIAIALLIAAVTGIELHDPLAIEPSGLVNLAIATAALAAAAFFYSRVRVNRGIAATCIGLIQALIFSAAGAILSYLLARDGGPLWDSTLHSWDGALGFDWLGYAHFVDRHAWLALPFRLAYASLIPQTVVLLLLLGFGGKLDRLRMFVLSAILTGTAAILLSPFFPAVGNFAWLGLHPSDFARVWQWSNLADVRDFLALRDGGTAGLDLRTMQGIIVFPSYHAALAAVIGWSFWKSGFRRLRWIGVAFALTTIAATPVDGGHYFVDVIAGLGLAIASIAAASRLAFVQLRLPLVRAWPSRRLRGAFAR